MCKQCYYSCRSSVVTIRFGTECFHVASIRDADALGQKIVFTLKKRFNFQRICLEHQLTLAWRTYLPAITRRVSSACVTAGNKYTCLGLGQAIRRRWELGSKFNTR